MPVSVNQLSFVGGEWSPSLYGRTDLAKYSTAVRKMRNAFPHPHGGVSNRGGTQYIAETKDSTKTARLIPFQFSVTQGYILEFGNLYMRVFMDGAQVMSGGNPYELVTTYLEADIPLLKFVQSADVLYVTHPSYPPRKISRTGHTAWTIGNISFTPSISAPTNFARSAGSGTGNSYKVTAISEYGEESEPSGAVAGGTGDTFTWTAVSGADYYSLYKDENASGSYGWIGYAENTTFKETASIDPDYFKTPPKARNPFNASGDYPGVCTFFEQRLIFARTNNNPQTIWGSVVGSFENMDYSSPLRDDDAYEFTINSRQVNEVRFLVPLENMVIGTMGGEWRMSAGSNSDAVTPTSVNMKMQSQWGVSDTPPILVGNTVLFLEGSNKVVRDLEFSLEADSYKGSNLTILATHLFEDYNITEWAYQQNPDSIIWAVRDDGALLGLTYYKEHDVAGWHRHDTDGYFESVACISTDEGVNEVYFIVRRTIDGNTVRYVERFIPRLPVNDNYESEVRDAFFVDSGLSYDVPIDIEDITATNPIVVTATAHGLLDGDIVDLSDIIGHIVVDPDVDEMTVLNNKRFVVTNKTANDFELYYENGDPVDGSAYADYVSGGYIREAVITVSGLDHIEGKDVSVLADGSVILNKTVTAGAVTLDRKASRIHVGLPYTTQIETLNFEYSTETGNTVQDKLRQMPSVVARLKDARALWVGPSEDRLIETLFREDELYGDPINLYSGDKEIFIEAGDSREGRLFIQNADPVPFTLLSLIVRFQHGEK